MNHPYTPRIGGVLSADIAVPDHERVLSFYSRVLTTGENPFWREDLMNSRGMPIIGLGERSPDHDELPLQWMPHIQVADVSVSVKRALEMGGNELMHEKGDHGKSQWAVLLDPNGAAFGLIPVVPEEAIPLVENESSSNDKTPIGCISWVDLTVPNAKETRDFYQRIVGWSVEEVRMEDANERYADYNMLGGDGNPEAGVCHTRGVNKGLPPVWMIYLPVGDLTESIRRVKVSGGKIIKTKCGRDGNYAYAVIQDPVGACMALASG